MCYKIVFGLTTGHTYKLYKHRSLTSTDTAFFGNRVINVRNNLSHDTVDFSTVKRFKSSLILSDLSKCLQYD